MINSTKSGKLHPQTELSADEISGVQMPSQLRTTIIATNKQRLSALSSITLPLPLLYALTDFAENICRPLEVFLREVNLPTQPHPPRARVEIETHESIVLIDQHAIHPVHDLERFASIALRLLFERKRQAYIAEKAVRQSAFGVVHDLSLELAGHESSSFARNVRHVSVHGFFALLAVPCEFLAPLDGRGYAKHGAVVHGADELEAVDEFAL